MNRCVSAQTVRKQNSAPRKERERIVTESERVEGEQRKRTRQVESVTALDLAAASRISDVESSERNRNQQPCRFERRFVV